MGDGHVRVQRDRGRMLNRRDLMKFFGAASIISPVMADGSIPPARARLIEEPKIEIVPADALPSQPGDSRNMTGPAVIRVDVWTQRGHFQFHAQSFVMQADCGLYKNWTLEGELVGNKEFVANERRLAYPILRKQSYDGSVR